MNGQNLCRKRIKLAAAAACLTWVLLSCRLFYWQVLCHQPLTEAAQAQYDIRVEGMDTRGRILDRNLQPLTDGAWQYCYFLKTDRVNAQVQSMLDAVLARNITSGQNLSPAYSVYRTGYFDEAVSRTLREEYGAYIFGSVSRYEDEQTACHLIGYLNDSEKRGVSGLEKVYEELLQPDGSFLKLQADGSGLLLLDRKPEVDGGGSFLRNNLVTTIDKPLQEFCESAFSVRNLEGAVLVSEVETGQILAWVSAPSFNPNQIERYLDGSGSNLVNKCVQGQYAPGSVFKIVTAAAALENSAMSPYTVYTCTGTAEVEGILLGCQSGPPGGHGDVDMYRAMAVSCNCYFAELGKELGCSAVLEMAERLGFGNPVFGIFAEEVSGNLPLAETCGPWDISNLSIGQGRILATPAQVHQMMTVIAGGGVRKQLQVVEGEVHAERVLPESAAGELKRMLQQVMTAGTGSGVSWNGEPAGKTGTAEAAVDGTPVNNCWFSGFFSAHEHTYAVTVLVEEGVSGSASALPVFRDVCDYLTVRNLYAD